MRAVDAENLIFEHLRLQKAHDRKLWSRSLLTQFSKYLRESGLLPSGGAGHSAPHIDATHFSNILLALAACEKPAQAVEAVATYSGLPTSDWGYLSTLTEFMARAVSDPVFAEKIESLSVSRTFARAVCKMQSGDDVKTIFFAREGTPKTGGGFDITVTLSGGFLSQLALDAADPHLKVGLDGRDLSAERPRSGWGNPITDELRKKLQNLGTERDA